MTSLFLVKLWERFRSLSGLSSGKFQPYWGYGLWIGEGQKETPGRGRDRKCHHRASLSRPLVLSLEPLTWTLMGGSAGASDKMEMNGEGDRFVMTFSDVFLPVPFLASPYDLHRIKNIILGLCCLPCTLGTSALFVCIRSISPLRASEDHLLCPGGHLPHWSQW